MIRVSSHGNRLLVHVEDGGTPMEGDAIVDLLEARSCVYKNRIIGGLWVIEVLATPRTRALLSDYLDG